MKVQVKTFNNITSWSNPEMAKFLHFIYGNIDMKIAINLQKVRYDEIRRCLNEAFVLSNIKEIKGLSFVDRYNLLKGYKLDIDAIIEYLNNLMTVNSGFVAHAKLNAPYKTLITPMHDLIPFMLEFTTYGIQNLRDALIDYKLYNTK